MLQENCLNSHWVYVHICDWLRLFLEAENFLCFRLLEKRWLVVLGVLFFFSLHAWFEFGLIQGSFLHNLKQSKGKLSGRGDRSGDHGLRRLPGCQFHHLWKRSREEEQVLNQVSQTVLSRKQMFYEILNGAENIWEEIKKKGFLHNCMRSWYCSAIICLW